MTPRGGPPRPAAATAVTLALTLAMALAIPLAIAVSACDALSSSSPPQGSAAARAEASTGAPRPARVLRVLAVSMERSIRVTGTLAPLEQATIGVSVAGRLASVAVDVGTVVAKNDVVARIETDDYELRVRQAAASLGAARALLGLPPEGDDDRVDIEKTGSVTEARATLEESRANLTRAHELFPRGLITPAELDTARATFVRSESALQRAREEARSRAALVQQSRVELLLAQRDLAETTVRSPLDGVVRARHAETGELVDPRAPVATIVRMDVLRLRVDVPERDAASVRMGQSVRVTIEGTREPLEGRIVRIAPALTDSSRTLSVEADIKNPGHLRAGSFARAAIVVGTDADTPAVPASAIIIFAGIEKVLTIRDGRVAEARIQTGRREGGLVEVLRGVAPGEQILAEPSAFEHGQAVTLAEDPA